MTLGDVAVYIYCMSNSLHCSHTFPQLQRLLSEQLCDDGLIDSGDSSSDDTTFLSPPRHTHHVSHTHRHTHITHTHMHYMCLLCLQCLIANESTEAGHVFDAACVMNSFIVACCGCFFFEILLLEFWLWITLQW